MSISATEFLSGVPETLRAELISRYAEIERNFREKRWEPSELNGGKLCEIVYSIIRGHVDGIFPSAASKPTNMVDACRALENASGYPRSIRIQIPRMLIALYEVRNNRGVGHVGGDVNPNEMDAVCVLQMCKWLVGELVRVFHSVTIDEAQAFVSALSERDIAWIWEINGKLRVLRTDLKYPDQTLLLLYSRTQGLHESALVESLEHKSTTRYRSDVLKRLHNKRLIEYDNNNGTAMISPLGAQHVEDKILTSA